MEPTPARRNIARALIVTASVVAFLSLFALWLNRQVLNTDNWTKASSEMLAKPAVRDQTAAFLTNELYRYVDVESEIRDALPDRFDALAAPAAGLLRDRVQLAAADALARPNVQKLWEDANRAAHETLLKVLDGGGQVVSTTNGEVVLDLKALLGQLEQQTGVGGRIAGALPAEAAQMTILKSDQLDTAQNVGKTLKGLPIVLVGLSLLLFGGALLVAPGYRRRAMRGYGFGLVAAGAGALAAGAWLGDRIVASLSTTAATEPAIRDVWDVYDSLLIQAATACILYGALMVGCAWLAGSTQWAVTTRRVSAPALRRPLIAYGALAAFVLVIIVWWAPTPATRNPVTAALLAALLAVGFEALRRQAAREHPLVQAQPAKETMEKEEANGHARVGPTV